MIGERLHNPAPPIFDARIRSANLDLSSRGAGRNRELAHYRLAIGLSGYGLNELIDDVAARLALRLTIRCPSPLRKRDSSAQPDSSMDGTQAILLGIYWTNALAITPISMSPTAKYPAYVPLVGTYNE